MPGYTKLFSSIVHSTIWREPDHVRLVWVTMLALADREGRIEASVPGLADVARVSLEQCADALKRFGEPDKWSRNRENEGRRIEDIEGGWRLLNHGRYRALMSADERREKDRVRKAEERSARRMSEACPQASEKVRKVSQAEAAPSPTPVPEAVQSPLTPVVTTEVIRRTYSCPEDLQPLPRHTARCAEFKLEVWKIIEELKRWEPEKPVGDWHKALDRFIATAIKNRNNFTAPKKGGAFGQAPRQPDAGKTGWERAKT